MSNHLSRLFSASKAIIGMIHVPALPGTPRYGGDIGAIIKQAVREARLYQQAGIRALAIENMHDVPYIKGPVGPEITAMMTRLGHEVKQASGLPCGIQLLAAANCQALAVAQAAGLDFVRAEGFVFGHLADEGYIDAQAGKLLRYRSQIGAEHIPIFTDIKKKHSAHALTADLDVVETARAAAFFLSDGLILTGAATGRAASVAEIKAVKAAVDLPVLVGSGITAENVGDYYACCDGFIVGSYFKQGGHWANGLDAGRIQRFMERIARLEAETPN